MLALDASPFGISAVLSHELPNESEAPVAFGSRTPRKSERNCSQLDNETPSSGESGEKGVLQQGWNVDQLPDKFRLFSRDSAQSTQGSSRSVIRNSQRNRKLSSLRIESEHSSVAHNSDQEMTRITIAKHKFNGEFDKDIERKIFAMHWQSMDIRKSSEVTMERLSYQISFKSFREETEFDIFVQHFII
ncbi:hypothetical protein T11_16444 [Trichinella zimbabwensis]|uniref:Reverse transcriptase/retrotransposon-derived protein RNase H-like domain-containing protein n=1 Tax=Trichinella zimbabwensis TaxID=268475 RepID=A0A0V1HLK9_9BILA|nr:hypothetical protein T11_16444 [Trichinella zimbabwensis]